MSDRATVRRADEMHRDELAVLVREMLLAGQLIDRAGMPHLIADYGRDEMGRIAIDEWMGASPIYTRRMQRMLGFSGETIETMFKGLQLDIGAPPEFMDFRLKVIDDHHGEFWLDHCGALMDVEPMGDEYVHTMCHDIEDPTFDATAMATSPYARIRPIHRPPRAPADRHPHCHWTATIDPGLDPLPEPEPATHIATSRLAALAVPAIHSGGEGWSDYRAPMDVDLRMEWFSQAALLGLLHETAVQAHLLVMSFGFAIQRRHGIDDARRIVAKQMAGIAGISSERLHDAMGLDGSQSALAQVLELHPLLKPRDYVAARIERSADGEGLRVALADCDALHEPFINWIKLLADGHDDGLRTLVQGVDLHYDIERVRPGDGEVAAWRVVRRDEPARESRLVALTRFSSGATFEFAETPVSLAREKRVSRSAR